MMAAINLEGLQQQQQQQQKREGRDPFLLPLFAEGSIPSVRQK